MPGGDVQDIRGGLQPDHLMMKNYKAAITWCPARCRRAGIGQDMRAEPGVVLETYWSGLPASMRKVLGCPMRFSRSQDST
jgi:hypothetical protein